MLNKIENVSFLRESNYV
jgi:hypothetical protein